MQHYEAKVSHLALVPLIFFFFFFGTRLCDTKIRQLCAGLKCFQGWSELWRGVSRLTFKEIASVIVGHVYSMIVLR